MSETQTAIEAISKLDLGALVREIEADERALALKRELKAFIEKTRKVAPIVSLPPTPLATTIADHFRSTNNMAATVGDIASALGMRAPNVGASLSKSDLFTKLADGRWRLRDFTPEEDADSDLAFEQLALEFTRTRGGSATSDEIATALGVTSSYVAATLAASFWFRPEPNGWHVTKDAPKH